MKIKHLIKKLSELDPEANVYYGDLEISPVKYIHLGTRLQKEKHFIFKKVTESLNPYHVKMTSSAMRRNGIKDKSELTGEDILLTSWNMEYE
jgi:hypothetical protein